MKVTIFPDVKATSKTEIEYSTLVKNIKKGSLKAPKKDDLSLVVLGTFDDTTTAKGSLRSDRSLLTLTGAAADYDGGVMPLVVAKGKLAEAGIKAILYESPSSTPEAPRWRILAPFSKAYHRDSTNLKDLSDSSIHKMEAVLGLKFGTDTTTLSQSYYVGGIEGKECRIAHLSKGKNIDRTITAIEATPADNLPEPRMYNVNPLIREFNDAYTVEEVLEQCDYTQAGDRWKSPRGESGGAGLVVYPPGNGLEWSTAASFHAGDAEILGEGKIHDAFSLYQHLKCGGKFKKAMKKAGKILDFDEAKQDAGLADDLVVSLGDFLAQDLPPIVTRLKPFLTDNGMGMIHAKPGVGKTWIMMDLAVALVTGRPWLGVYEVDKKLLPDEGFLIVDGEMPPNLLQKRWADLTRPLTEKERTACQQQVKIFSTIDYQLRHLKSVDLGHETWRNKIVEWCDSWNLKVVSLDNKASLLVEEEENSNDGAVRDFLPWLMHLRGLGIATVLLGHTGHTGDHLRGGSAWNGPMDWIMHLKEKSAELEKVQFSIGFKKARYGLPLDRTPDISLFDLEDGVALLRSSDDVYDLSAIEIQLMLKVQGNPGLSQRGMAKALDVSQPKIRRTKASLIERGFLAPRKDWEATQKGESWLADGEVDLDEI